MDLCIYMGGEKLVALKAMNNETLIYFPNKLERVG